MEAVFKILKQLMGTAGTLGDIPKPIKMGVLYLGAFVAVMAIFKFTPIGQTEKTFLIIALVVLVVITAGWYAWKYLAEKQHNQQFGGEISQHSSATPRGLSDPGQRARLDDMRKKFQTGIEAYKSRGKDLYKLPWYAIVGEPGSGKTEAVRHSNVGFPPGMQDEFQGVGGTINMNWWFTNHAVLLDTAGRLMFEDVKPGETSEWREFLTLLKKNRPNCPINGLYLVIPADSLIKDTAESIQNKAGKIAQQLDVIQRVLDVRFPVFVVITKCDKINGFREFFDGLSDPQLQHQIMGWSKPGSLDDPFKPELVEKHLDDVANRLRRRRLGLLRDPVPENEDGRRTDEVDTLFAFPHSLGQLGSRLRRYLETIFVPGEWSAKPLFLRGIYFSSSMREGAALDAELAEAIGLKVEELPEGKVWERERAYFLRDLFIEKIFRERGLVTRASDTKRMLRSQQIALYGFGFASLLVFSALAWFALGNLRRGVKDQGDYWKVVSDAGWENKFWKQSIVPMRGDGSFASAISTNALLVDNKPRTLGEFHSKLRELAEQRLSKNLIFPGLADKYNQNSRKSQRIVFEAGVVRPLLEATRQKMATDSGEAGSGQRQAEALASLIQLEADVLSRGTGTNKGELGPDGARKFLSTFENYIAGHEVEVDSNLVAVMSWTYSTNETAKGSWPGKWLSGGRNGTNTLAVNAGINAGLELFVRNATNGLQTHLADWGQISALYVAASNFAACERALFSAAAAENNARFNEAYKAVESSAKLLEDASQKASTHHLFGENPSLASAQQKFQAALTSSAGAALNRIRAVNEAALAANKDYPLFNEIKTHLDAVQASLSTRITQLVESGDLKEFQRLDETCFTNKAFAKRVELYARAEKLAIETPFAGAKLVGLKGEQLDKFLKEPIAAVRSEATNCIGSVAADTGRVITYQLKRAEKAQSDSFFAAYLSEAKRLLGTESGFPLVSDLGHIITAEKIKAASRQLKYISEDLAGDTFKKSSLRERSEEWKRFIVTVEGQQSIVKGLVGEDGLLGTCRVSLAPMTDATRSKDVWRGTWRDMKLVTDGATSEAIRTESESELGEVPIQQKLEFRLIKNVGDANSPTHAISTGEWGPLWLIHKHHGERDKTDPRMCTWSVEFPADAPGAAGSVRVKLKFERPLPDLENWPAP